MYVALAYGITAFLLAILYLKIATNHDSDT